MSQEGVGGVLIRSDARLTLADLVRHTLGALQRREKAREPNHHSEGDADQGVDNPAGR